MRLDFFIVAESAIATNGKLFIHGGAITNVAPTSLPWVHPQLALVLRIEVEPPDEGHAHEIVVRLRDPQGTEVVPPLVVPLPAEGIPEREPDRSIFLNATLTIATIPFEASGSYSFVAEVDGVEMGVERIYVHEPRGPDAGQLDTD